jgi:hypothetical protein
MGGANGSRECAPDDKLRDTHQLHLMGMMGFAGSTHPTYYVLPTGMGRDHLIDACVCAVAARDSASRLGGDEVDIGGLQMQINC